MAYSAILRTRPLNLNSRSPVLRTLHLAYPAVMRTRQLNPSPKLRPVAGIGSPSPGSFLVAYGIPVLLVGWHEFVERCLRTLQEQNASTAEKKCRKEDGKPKSPPPGDPSRTRQIASPSRGCQRARRPPGQRRRGGNSL
jgi:hypothetical protein